MSKTTDTHSKTHRQDPMAGFLLTGGGGFIGSAIARKLVEQGERVAVVDTATFSRLESVPQGDNLVVENVDVRDPGAVDAWVSRSRCVIHLAAVVGVREYLQRPKDVLDVNIMGTRNVLQACSRHGKPVVICSTSEVFGKNFRRLHERSDRCFGSSDNNRWAYAISKCAGEHYARAFGLDGLRYLIVRYFNVYGPLQDEPGSGRVISKFLGDLMQDRDLSLVDGGKPVRSFCYIDDAVDATILLARRLESDPAFSGRSLHIGRAEPVSIRELAERMISLSGRPVGTVDVEGTAFWGDGFEEIPYRVPDMDGLKKATGYEARTTLDEGLKKTLAHWDLLATDGPGEPDADGVCRAPIVQMVRPFFEPDERLMGEIQELLRSGLVTNNGPRVGELEKALSVWLGVEDLACVANGSAALSAAIGALGTGPGKAIIPSFTYVSTVNSVLSNHLTPVYCDIDPWRYTLDPDHLNQLLQRNADVRLIVPVNVYGIPPDLDRILETASENNIPVVYDNAHGLGTTWHDRRLADGVAAQIFSLHATKAMPSIEGGVVCSEDPGILNAVRQICNHGLAPDRSEARIGFNGKMDEIRAVVALHSLAGFTGTLERRRAYFHRLRKLMLDELSDTMVPQVVPDDVEPNGQNLGVRHWLPAGVGIDDVRGWYREFGVEARRYFWPALHRIDAHRSTEPLPNTDRVVETLLCLPLHSHMDEGTLLRVERALRKVADRITRIPG